MNQQQISNNALSIIALANEYCSDIEHVEEYEKEEFLARMLKVLPRIYITMSDFECENNDVYGDVDINSALTEEAYNITCNKIEQLMGADDVYLEVFVEDMQYSDTPISASISENLADIYQPLYNLISSVKDAAIDDVNAMLLLCKEDFVTYWAQVLCNVLRALNMVYYSMSEE